MADETPSVDETALQGRLQNAAPAVRQMLHALDRNHANGAANGLWETGLQEAYRTVFSQQDEETDEAYEIRIQSQRNEILTFADETIREDLERALRTEGGAPDFSRQLKELAERDPNKDWILLQLATNGTGPAAAAQAGTGPNADEPSVTPGGEPLITFLETTFADAIEEYRRDPAGLYKLAPDAGPTDLPTVLNVQTETVGERTTHYVEGNLPPDAMKDILRANLEQALENNTLQLPGLDETEKAALIDSLVTDIVDAAKAEGQKTIQVYSTPGSKTPPIENRYYDYHSHFTAAVNKLFDGSSAILDAQGPANGAEENQPQYRSPANYSEVFNDASGSAMEKSWAALTAAFEEKYPGGDNLTPAAELTEPLLPQYGHGIRMAFEAKIINNEIALPPGMDQDTFLELVEAAAELSDGPGLVKEQKGHAYDFIRNLEHMVQERITPTPEETDPSNTDRLAQVLQAGEPITLSIDPDTLDEPYIKFGKPVENTGPDGDIVTARQDYLTLTHTFDIDILDPKVDDDGNPYFDYAGEITSFAEFRDRVGDEFEITPLAHNGNPYAFRITPEGGEPLIVSADAFHEALSPLQAAMQNTINPPAAATPAPTTPEVEGPAISAGAPGSP